MALKLKFPEPVLWRPVNASVLRRTRNRSLDFKILVVTENQEQHILLLFNDLGAAYHIRSLPELDKIIDTLGNLRDTVANKKVKVL